MSQNNYILALDDDPYVLDFVSEICHHAKVSCIIANSAEEALLKLKNAIDSKCILAIVDLFLDGARGDELSNNFISDHLLPNNIPFVRLTSAPSLVPTNLSGLLVFDKRKILQNSDELLDFILSMK